jgi:mono/diheme cytochrome c family protein
MRKLLVAGVIIAFGWAGLSLSSGAAQDAKAKFTIKQVMKTAHKDKRKDKVAKGDASADEKKQLVELYEALAANKPPKGDEADWKAKTAALVAAAKDAEAGKAGAGEALTKAANCMECHTAHKGK